MKKLSNIVQAIGVRTTSFCAADRAPLLALLWVLSNLFLGWIAVRSGHPNVGALAAGALDGAVFSSIVLVKASARLEAGVTGLLSGFGIDSVTNSGHAIARLVHGVHEGLESLVEASGVDKPCGHHQDLELMVMRAIWIAVIVVLLTLFVKWGETPAAVPAAAPMPALVAHPSEIARAQAA
jgi:hypothetical protein